MDKSENYLISSSCDCSIIIWKINYDMNDIFYEYSLKKHEDTIN